MYALTKELQWRRPLEFENFFSLFLEMHIEQSMQDVDGDITRGSGLPEVLKISNLSVTGTDAVIKINHLKRVRYCIQLTVCTIYKKIKEAYLKSESRLPLIQWLNKRSTESNMAFVWELIFNVYCYYLFDHRGRPISNYVQKY